MKLKRVLSLLILGFLPFFLLADDEPTAGWIPPTLEDVTVWNNFYGSPGEACVNSQTYLQAIISQPTATYEIVDITIGSFAGMGFKNCEISNSSGIFQVVLLVPTTVVTSFCNDPDYQNGIDSDGLDGVDQCWSSLCPKNDLFWSVGNGLGTPTGQVCVVNPINGQNCKYSAIENSDGSESIYTFRQDGEGCNCSNELVPCADLADGEITNFPQGQDGCTSMGDSIFCTANPEEECSNGVCNAGCGYIGEAFYCIQSQIDPVDTEACGVGDVRPSCQGVSDGECPNGVTNCGDNADNSDGSGDPADDPNDVADSGDLDALGELLKQGNRNTKKNADNTKKISDELTRKHTTEDYAPDSDWDTTKSDIEAITNGDYVNDDESFFFNSFSPQEKTLSNTFLGIIPTSGSCQNMSIPFPDINVTIDFCSHVAPLKTVLEYALILLFIIYLVSAFKRLTPSGD